VRRAGLLLALVTILASSASPAAAHHSPDACNANLAELTISSDRLTVRPGDTITYTVLASNQGMGACDVTASSATVTLPAANGTAGGTTVPLSLPAGGELPAGTMQTPVGTVPYTVAVDPGVTTVTARVDATGVVHNGTPDAPAAADDHVGTTTTQPRLGLAFSASPLRALAPFTATYEFVVSNTSTTDVPMDPPTVGHDPCTPIYADGDTNTNNRLDTAESWRYRCTRTLATPSGITSDAVASARSRIDGETVVSPRSAPLALTADTPPAATLILSRSVSPASGPAPLTATHTYTLHNDSGADPRPVRNVTLDDRVCAPVTRTSGDDLLGPGESWTYTCTQTLATAGTVSGTAVAAGVDDLGFNTVSSSNFAGIELTATGVSNAPTPVPTATPEPEPEPEPTVTPSRRVNLATTSGRLARPCGKTATAKLKVGKRLIASKRIRLDSRCRYRVRFTNVTRSRLRGATRVSVTVRSGRRTATHRVAVPKR
jgi:uncharacterized repeat protein (TIGR01451 family)